MEQIDITQITDLQLASFSMRADEEFIRAMQNKQMIRAELARREKLVNQVQTGAKQEPKKEVKK